MDNVLPLIKKDFSFEDEIRELTDLCKEDLISVNTIILDKLDSNVPLVPVSYTHLRAHETP